jgi:MYXO-CTERM domain-containing protein
MLVLGAAAIQPAAAAEPERVLLERHRPVLRYDGAERHFAQPVGSDARGADRIYGHVAEQDGVRWLQYWLYFSYNPQDRGILRTGRHEGDWEFAQVRLDEAGRPIRADLSQHTWGESCGWSELETAAGSSAPVLYVANGSHALYSAAGTHDRPWPDPNDEAGGDGREVRPVVTAIGEEGPPWVLRDEPWGRTRAGWIPGEQSSPPGPRFQNDGRWFRPADFEDDALSCGSDPPGRAWQTWALTALVAALAAVAAFRFRRRRST